jgi:hypothetical protein
MPRNKLRSAREDTLSVVEAGILLEACRDLLDNLVVRLPLLDFVPDSIPKDERRVANVLKGVM